MSITPTASALLAPPNKTPSQRSSRGSNEFNPRIILNNSLKNSMENSNRQSGLFGANGQNSFVARNSTTSYPDFPMINPSGFSGNIRNSGQLNPHELINNHNSTAGNNRRGSSFFQNIQDFVRGNSGSGIGMMQNMYLGPLKPSQRLSDPDAKSSPNSHSFNNNQGESEKDSLSSSIEVKQTNSFVGEFRQDPSRQSMYQQLNNDVMAGALSNSNRMSQMLLQDSN